MNHRLLAPSFLPDSLKGRTLGDMVVGQTCFAHVEALCVDAEGYCYVALSRQAYQKPLSVWNGVYLTITRHEEYMGVDVSHASTYRWFYGTKPRTSKTLPALLVGVETD